MKSVCASCRLQRILSKLLIWTESWTGNDKPSQSFWGEPGNCAPQTVAHSSILEYRICITDFRTTEIVDPLSRFWSFHLLKIRFSGGFCLRVLGYDTLWRLKASLLISLGFRCCRFGQTTDLKSVKSQSGTPLESKGRVRAWRRGSRSSRGSRSICASTAIKSF